MKFPAVTICPKVSFKYGIAERLGNYIDSSSLPEELLLMKNIFFKCVFDAPSDIDKLYESDNFLENNVNSVKVTYNDNNCYYKSEWNPVVCKVCNN